MHGHCSFKAKTKTQNFCRNEYNVSGLCNRSSCPLANSRYATIREDRATGRLYLYMKTIERAHTPAKLWQKVRLASSYAKALQQVDEHLAHFPKFLAHKNKQRLTKITQYLIRARRLALRPKATLVPLATRTEQRERRREAKAEQAARLETSIEQELLQRLRSGTYGDIYNFPEKEYEAVLDRAEAEMEEAEEEGGEGGQKDGGARYVEGDSEDDDDEEEYEDDYELEYEGEDGDDGGELEEDSEGPEDPSDDEDEEDDEDVDAEEEEDEDDFDEEVDDEYDEGDNELSDGQSSEKVAADSNSPGVPKRGCA